MHLDVYLGLQHKSEDELAEAFATVGDHHQDEPDVALTCRHLAQQCRRHAGELRRFVQQYGETPDHEMEDIYHALFKGPRSGGVGLLRDLQDLYLLTSMCQITWQMLKQAALALRDEELKALCGEGLTDTHTQLTWLLTRMKTAAPQALLVAQ